MLLLMGIAGSGKGTQGQLLTDHFGYKVFSMGDVIRSQASPAQLEQVQAGRLLSDEDAQELLASALKSADDQSKVILDGFPRTVAQAEWLLGQDFTVELAVHLDASETEVKNRLLARGRHDDTEEGIKKRFEAYQQQTVPILDYLKGQNVTVAHINAEQDVASVNKDIEQAIDANTSKNS